jgi:dihydroneopterin aldolase
MKFAVAKLGGSTTDDDAFRGWADAFDKSSVPLIVVPGGGPFADAIRDQQPRLAFSDAAAHAMAILAMEQFGHVLLDHRPSMKAARSDDEIRLAIGEGRSAVWMPSAMTLSAPEIARSWDITSDSLAAWLAMRLHATALLLVKQTDDFSAADSPASLAARGIVDPAFPALLAHATPLYLAGPGHLTQAGDYLARGELPGLRIGAAMRKAG